MSTVGILGAGKLGSVLAHLTTNAGYPTLVAGSGQPERIELVLNVLAPAAHAVDAVRAVRDSDLIILAIPLSRHKTLPTQGLAGKIVVDAMNYWPPSDGIIPEFATTPSSLVIARALPGARVVKALSHLGYHELGDDARPAGAPDRHSIALAGDDQAAVDTVAKLIDRIGFDPVRAGDLNAGSKFGPGSELFGLSEPRNVVERILADATATTTATNPMKART